MVGQSQTTIAAEAEAMRNRNSKSARTCETKPLQTMVGCHFLSPTSMVASLRHRFTVPDFTYLSPKHRIAHMKPRNLPCGVRCSRTSLPQGQWRALAVATMEIYSIGWETSSVTSRVADTAVFGASANRTQVCLPPAFPPPI